MTSPAPIVVFSHLRWDFVYQRPQHLISRLAAMGRRVVVVEEPVHRPGAEPTLEVGGVAHGLSVARPVLPFPAAGFDAGAAPLIADLLIEFLDGEDMVEPVAWFYTPMALPIAEAIEPLGMVYDCMDELSLFLGAPPALVHLEARLLEQADVVFTGGVSLHRAKQGRHPNVHCFPSSVDAAHFRRARRADATDEPADQALLPGPRLGFFGVIDERIDLDVLDRLATAGDWQVVLVGPVVKIDPRSLPRHPNLHYFGQRTYDELPRYLAGWDICLLPFARNAATRFISPTKTLEYMAAERPIVSTPITDVAEPYGDVVYLAEDPDAFVGACRRALSAPAEERADRAARMREVLARTSWDATARAMAARVDAAVAARLARSNRRLAAGA